MNLSQIVMQTIHAAIAAGDVVVKSWVTQRIVMENLQSDDSEFAKAELQIKGRNGRIQDCRTYGRDPRRTRG